MNFKPTEKEKAKAYIDTREKPFRIVDIKRKRSLNQNDYYWVCLTLLGLELGYHKDELHELFLARFAPHRDTLGTEWIVRTSKMDSAQFTAYFERVRLFAYHEFQFSFPEPDSVTELYNQLVERGIL